MSTQTLVLLFVGLLQAALIFQQNRIIQKQSKQEAKGRGKRSRKAWPLLARYWPMVVMLVLVVLAWLPAFLAEGHPKAIVQVDEIEPAYEKGFVLNEGAPFILNVHIKNQGPEIAKSFGRAFRVSIFPRTVPEDSINEAFSEFRERYDADRRRDLGVDKEIFFTLGTNDLDRADVESLVEGRERLYVYGYIQWYDSNGDHELQYCRWLQPPAGNRLPAKAIWHSCGVRNTIE